ncbi:MAG: hypothetical protein ACPGQL_11045, partial [Thermoplasmatota archaeon]
MMRPPVGAPSALRGRVVTVRFAHAFVIAPLLALVLAGCTGPAGLAPGDMVLIEFTATDAETGQPIPLANSVTGQMQASERIVFAIGSGDSGFGTSFERALLGKDRNDTFSVRTQVATAPASASRDLGSGPISNEVPMDLFTQNFGEAEVGVQFAIPNHIYDGVVTAVGADTVTFDFVVAEGDVFPVDDLGVQIVSHVDGSDFRAVLHPLEGRFVSVQAGPTGQTPLGLPAGGLRVLGANETHILYEHSARGQLDLWGRDLKLQVTVIDLD